MRFLSFFIMIWLSTLLSPVFICLFAIAYAMRWRAYELIGIGLLADAYFGVQVTIPYYTIGAIAIVFVVELMKPRLLVYAS